MPASNANTEPELMVSVIIPAYLRTELLRKAIRSVLSQDFDPGQYEVIVVDSSPNDANANLAAVLQDEARCSLRCFTKSPEGPGPSRNLGAHQARGRILAFMDSDCEASPQWVREGVAAFTEGVGLVQGRTMPETGVPHSVFNRSLTVEHESFVYEGGNVLYRRDAFERARGFPVDLHPEAVFPMGGEDVDLAWRVKRAGWLSRFAAQALVYHAVERREAWRWFVDQRLYILPRLVGDYPELRQFFFAGYFLDRMHAATGAALLGLAFAWLAPASLLAVLPYVVMRTTESSRSLHGPARMLRPLFYLPRDLVSFCLLLAGSIRFRSLLL